jgi:hypothetical protein
MEIPQIATSIPDLVQAFHADHTSNLAAFKYLDDIF